VDQQSEGADSVRAFEGHGDHAEARAAYGGDRGGKSKLGGDLPACKSAGVRWYIVEQDICQRDPFEIAGDQLTEFEGDGIELVAAGEDRPLKPRGHDDQTAKDSPKIQRDGGQFVGDFGTLSLVAGSSHYRQHQADRSETDAERGNIMAASKPAQLARKMANPMMQAAAPSMLPIWRNLESPWAPIAMGLDVEWLMEAYYTPGITSCHWPL